MAKQQVTMTVNVDQVLQMSKRFDNYARRSHARRREFLEEWTTRAEANWKEEIARSHLYTGLYHDSITSTIRGNTATTFSAAAEYGYSRAGRYIPSIEYGRKPIPGSGGGDDGYKGLPWGRMMEWVQGKLGVSNRGLAFAIAISILRKPGRRYGIVERAMEKTLYYMKRRVKHYFSD